MHKLILIVLALAAFAAHAERVYKCTSEDGHVTYSQQVCADDAQALDVQTHSQGVDFVAEGDFTKVEQGNERRARTRKIKSLIENHRNNIKKLINARNNRIKKLRREQAKALNNAAGALYRGSVETHIQTTVQDYRSRIQRQEDAIVRLKEQY